QPVAGGVVPHQSRSYDGTVGVDDPPAGGGGHAVVGFGVGDRLGPVEHGGAAGDAGFGQSGRPQARLADATRQRRHLDLAVEAETRQGGEIDSGRALHDDVATGVHVEQRVECRCVVPRVEAAPPTGAAGGIGDHDGVAGDRSQRVGDQDVDALDV